jgi:glycine dehydrogenase subunit 2
MSATAETPLQREAATTIFEKGAAGRRAFACPELDVPEVEGLLPDALRRSDPPRLPEVSEPELVRHYVNLSKRNFDLDSGFYPLGSCTMKHNPRLHERVAAMAGHARLHPLQDPARAQGALELMWNLERALAEIAGLPHVSLQPSAGSHGELAGRAADQGLPRRARRGAHQGPHARHGPRHEPRHGHDGRLRGGQGRHQRRRRRRPRRPARQGRRQRRVPDAHQPQHAGHLRRQHRGDRPRRARRGGDALLRRRQLNAVMGISRPGDMGFDIVHFNLHKSFTQPHGGGGPGSGPIAVSDRIEPFLPRPVITRGEDGRFDLDDDRPKSIGKLRGFQGNYGCFVRSYAYIRSLGAEGSRTRRRRRCSTPTTCSRGCAARRGRQLPLAFGELCMHEFVLSGAPMKRELQIRTLDLPSACSTTASTRRPSTSRCWSTRRCSSSRPRPRRARRSTPSPTCSPASCARRAEDPTIAREAPYSTPVRASTRPRREAARHPPGAVATDARGAFALPAARMAGEKCD